MKYTEQWHDKIEERLARLEKKVWCLDDNTGLSIPEPSKVTQHVYGNLNPCKKCGCDVCVCKPEKLVTEPIGSGHTGACKEGCQCSIAQWKRTDDKPSEYIRISRKIAEEWVNAINDDGNLAQDLDNEIRKALEAK